MKNSSPLLNYKINGILFVTLYCTIASFLFLLTSNNSFAQTGFALGNYKEPYKRTATVFVPGILGSKIEGIEHNIWGNFPIVPERLVFSRDRESPRASPMDGVIVSGIELARQAYGNFLHETRWQLGASEWFHPFSYDWRQSNSTSADELHEHICKVTKNGQHPVRLIAHSMGTLVVRLWIMNSYPKGCPGTNSSQLNVEDILMVAAPAIGAPQSVVTLLTGNPNLFPILEEVFTRDFGVVGLSFDSIYELLPMQHAFKGEFQASDMCVGELGHRRDEATRYRVFYRPTTGDTSVLNIYSASHWLRLGLEPRLKKLRDFYKVPIPDIKAYLQDKLDRARENACRLVQHQIPQELKNKITTVAGQILKENTPINSTIDSILISDKKIENTKHEFTIEDKNSGRERYVYINLLAGDETVPIDVALFNSGTREYREAGDHLEVMSSHLIGNLLSQTIDRAWLQLGPVDKVDSQIS